MKYDDKMFVEKFERGISRTILEQMGGETQLRMMTGCTITIGQACVTISVPRPAKGYCKRVHIDYDWGEDLYKVNGYTIRGRLLQEHKGIYAEELAKLFEKMTGYIVRI